MNIENVFRCGSAFVASALNSTKIVLERCFKALAKFQQQLDVDWDESNRYQTPIFYNKNLLIGGKSFFYKSLLEKRIFYIRDFMDSNGYS